MATWRRICPLISILALLGGFLIVPSIVKADPSLSHMRVPFIGTYKLSEACLSPSSNSNHRDGAEYAIDVPMENGTPIYSPVSGTLVTTQSGWINGYGNTVLILDQYGLYTRLAHMAKVYTTTQYVDQGDLVGLASNTGGTVINGKPMRPHLHWHVQDGINQGSSEGINLDSVTNVNVTNCSATDYVGTAEGEDLAENPYSWCPTFGENNVAEAKLFDHAWCKGNLQTLSTPGVLYKLYSSFDNRARSLYVPPGKSVFVADDAMAPSARWFCANEDKWDLDEDYYYNSAGQKTSVRIGWNGGSGTSMVSAAMLFDEPDCKLNGVPFLGVVNNQTYVSAYFWNNQQNNGLLSEYSVSESLPFGFSFHVVVNNTTGSDYYDAMQLCVGTTCNETSTLSMNWNWNTYGHDDGLYDVKLRYRTAFDSGNWTNADVIYEGELYLSPVRTPYAPCSSNADGVELTSGSDCIIVTKDVGDLAPIGWSDRSNVTACMNGAGAGWLYDDATDEIGNYLGMAYVIEGVNCQSVGNTITSVNLKDATDIPPTLPSEPFSVDRDTVHLWHFEDSHPDYIANGDTVSNAAGGMSGNVTVGQWVGGAYGDYGLGFFSANSGRGLTFGTMDICPITLEGWVHFISLSGSGDGRIAGQLGGGGNSGSNKWLLSTDDYKPKFEIWSSSGSKSTISYREITDTNWHYIMATYDCSSQVGVLYLDNEVVGTFVSPSNWNSGATTFEVGTVEGIYRCDCEVDEIRISDVVRVPEWPASWGIIENGGFEATTSGWADGWNKTGSTVSIATNASGDEGANSLFLDNNGSNTLAVTNRYQVETQNVYSWKSYIKSTSGTGQVELWIDEYNASGTWIDDQHLDTIGVSHDGIVEVDYIPSSSDVVSTTFQYMRPGGGTADFYIDSVSVTLVGPENLAPNPSFESLSSGWATDWTRDNSAAASINTSSNGNDGTSSLNMAASSAGGYAHSDYIWIEPDTWYGWDSYLKFASGSGTLELWVIEFDANSNWVGDQQLATIDDTREGVSTFYYLPTNADVAQVRIQYYLPGGGTYAGYIDSVDFYKVSARTNLALGKTTTTSSIEDGTLTGAKAVDGNEGTRWASQEAHDPEWIYVDLGSVQTINNVVLQWEDAYGKDYVVQTSNDASTWTTIHTVNDGDGDLDNLTVSGSGRYVRIYGTERGTPWGYSLWELEVYGN